VETSPALVLRSDRLKILQILTNLLTNANKFTENGRVAIRSRREGQGVLLHISDTGIGMSAEAMARVFQPFMQADTSTTRQYGGTGLGLTLVKRFSEFLGGHVTVESEEGLGTSFAVWLPDHPRSS